MKLQHIFNIGSLIEFLEAIIKITLPSCRHCWHLQCSANTFYIRTNVAQKTADVILSRKCQPQPHKYLSLSRCSVLFIAFFLIYIFFYFHGVSEQSSCLTLFTGKWIIFSLSDSSIFYFQSITIILVTWTRCTTVVLCDDWRSKLHLAVSM